MIFLLKKNIFKE